MKHISIPLTLLALAVWTTGAHPASPLQAGGPVATVRAYLDTLGHAGFSGTVLVEFQGTPVISEGYGYSDLRDRRKNSPRTVFDIGSVTKQFTAAAILKLEMQGKLSTDDRLSKFFGDVPPDKSDITLHHLLRHSSGLRSNIGGDYDRITNEAFVDSVLRSPLGFPCGTAFSYSNIGYSLLGIIIEEVSGISYEAYLYEQLWRPAGMEQTGYTRPRFDDDLVAIGYHNDDRAWGRPTEQTWGEDGPFWHLKGNGGILSTAEELLKWDRALATDTILSARAKEKMYRPKLREGEGEGPYYGYGWDVGRTRRNTWRYWHNGSNGIFYTDFYRFVDEGTTVILLTNKSNGIQGLGREIVAALFTPGYTPAIPIMDNESNRSFTERALSVTLRQGVEAGERELRERTPGVNLLEQRANQKGYELLNARDVKGAIAIFSLNVLAFPGSANTYDSLGEAYMAAGDTTMAIENYRKSLALDPGNANAEEMLRRLERR